jgi:hypothetical protein
MLSNALEMLGFCALVAGTYELAGRGLALLVLAGSLFVLGLAVEGVRPFSAVRVVVLRRWQAFRERREAAKTRRVSV